jgi:hypothetical protein
LPAKEVAYIYLGDRNTVYMLRKKQCTAVRRNNKCIRGRNGSMLVVFEDGKQAVVIARLLRKIKAQA